MKIIAAGVLTIFLMLAGTAMAEVPATAPATQPDVAKLIADMASDSGQVRVSATKAIFGMGKDALEPLAKAGAKQISPFGGVESTRLDVVYSLLEGLKPNPAGAGAGYAKGSFGIYVEKDCSKNDLAKMGGNYGFTLQSDFDAKDRPQCFVKLDAGKKLAEVLKEIMLNEPKVISITLNYFET